MCGDGRLQAGEQCDDGNGSDTDDCRTDCTTGPGGETCQDGTLTLTNINSDLDLGWTGMGHHQFAVELTSLTGALDCAGTTCVVDGTAMAGAAYLSPLPLSVGGVGMCILSTVTEGPTGTFDCTSGCTDLALSLSWSVFLRQDVAQPCPVCLGDNEANDGQANGTCSADAASPGAACDVSGVSQIFPPTSHDCLPSGIPVGTIPIDLAPLTTGSATSTGGVDCLSPLPPPGACHCPGQIVPNACFDGTCPPSGVCEGGPIDGHCSDASYRGCPEGSGTTSCEDVFPGSGTCVTAPRPCFGATIERTGRCDTQQSSLAATFCMGATSAPAINTVLGLPGPGAITIETLVSR
jgi:cysteine-rich repeat protein